MHHYPPDDEAWLDLLEHYQPWAGCIFLASMGDPVFGHGHGHQNEVCHSCMGRVRTSTCCIHNHCLRWLLMGLYLKYDRCPNHPLGIVCWSILQRSPHQLQKRFAGIAKPCNSRLVGPNSPCNEESVNIAGVPWHPSVFDHAFCILPTRMEFRKKAVWPLVQYVGFPCPPAISCQFGGLVVCASKKTTSIRSNCCWGWAASSFHSSSSLCRMAQDGEVYAA